MREGPASGPGSAPPSGRSPSEFPLKLESDATYSETTHHYVFFVLRSNGKDSFARIAPSVGQGRHQRVRLSQTSC